MNRSRVAINVDYRDRGCTGVAFLLSDSPYMLNKYYLPFHNRLCVAKQVSCCRFVNVLAARIGKRWNKSKPYGLPQKARPLYQAKRLSRTGIRSSTKPWYRQFSIGNEGSFRLIIPSVLRQSEGYLPNISVKSLVKCRVL